MAKTREALHAAVACKMRGLMLTWCSKFFNLYTTRQYCKIWLFKFSTLLRQFCLFHGKLLHINVRDVFEASHFYARLLHVMPRAS